MPPKRHMRYEGRPYFRWVKMYRRVRYRVTCQELGAMVWTEEGSRRLANEWWERKLAEVHGPTQEEKAVGQVRSIPVERLKEAVERGQAARAILQAMPLVGSPAEIIEEVVQVSGRSEDVRVDLLSQLVGRVDAPAVEPNRTLEFQGGKFLDKVKLDGLRPDSYRDIEDFVKILYTCPPLAGRDVSCLTADKVEEVAKWLKNSQWGPTARKKRWDFFKRFVRYMAKKDVIPMPNNLDEFKFKLGQKRVKTYPLALVRGAVAGLAGQMRLYALLGLNCGMTASDIGQMTKGEVDLGGGTITRRRVKTGDIASVPTVTYRLWGSTLALLKECWSAHPTLALTSSAGTCLYDQGDIVGRKRTTNLIAQQWQRRKVGIPQSEFRSISATVLESHEHYGRYCAHFLAHAPASVKDKHYAAPSQELFDKIMVWLHDELFGGEGV